MFPLASAHAGHPGGFEGRWAVYLGKLRHLGSTEGRLLNEGVSDPELKAVMAQVKKLGRVVFEERKLRLQYRIA